MSPVGNILPPQGTGSVFHIYFTSLWMVVNCVPTTLGERNDMQCFTPRHGHTTRAGPQVEKEE